MEKQLEHDIDRLNRRVATCRPRAGDLRSRSAHALLKALLHDKQRSLALLQYERAGALASA